MIYELVGHSTLNDPSKSFALLRTSQQLRLEAKSSWSQVLDAEVNRSSEETQQVQAICDIVRKRLVARLRNDPNLLRDRVSLRLYYLRKAFLMAMEEMEQWKGELQMLCIEMYKMRTDIVRNEALAPWKRCMTRTYETEKLEVPWHKPITAEMGLILRERGGVEMFPRDNALMVWTLTARYLLEVQRYRLLRMTTIVWCVAVIANGSGDNEAYLPSTEWEQ
nr:hypothetical protein B0A51_07219 [Rachicladosporium sp. CCFEE 5018]